MAWNVAYGQDREFYATLGPAHKVNASKPSLIEDGRVLHEAFSHLSFSRPSAFDGLAAITLTEIECYCRLVGIPQLERQTFMRLIQRLDGEFMALVQAKRDKKTIVINHG